MGTVVGSACSPELEHRLGHREVEGRSHLDVRGARIQHLNRPAESFVEGGIVRDAPALLPGPIMALLKLLNLETLGRLSSPEFGSIRRLPDAALGIHSLDRVRHRCGGNQRHTRLDPLGAAIQERRLHQAASTVVDQHMLGPGRKARQTSQYRVLTRVAP